MPQFVKGNDDIVNKMADLIKSVIHATDNLKNTQEIYHASALTLHETISFNQEQTGNLSSDLSEIKSLLTNNVSNTQEIYQASERAMQENMAANQERINRLSTDLSEIKLLLREGFRLKPVNTDSE